ncbi:hypothetical protein [Lyngbya aestuarii]
MSVVLAEEQVNHVAQVILYCVALLLSAIANLLATHRGMTLDRLWWGIAR